MFINKVLLWAFMLLMTAVILTGVIIAAAPIIAVGVVVGVVVGILYWIDYPGDQKDKPPS